MNILEFRGGGQPEAVQYECKFTCNLNNAWGFLPHKVSKLVCKEVNKKEDDKSVLVKRISPCHSEGKALRISKISIKNVKKEFFTNAQNDKKQFFTSDKSVLNVFRQRKNKCAFTLAEVLITLGIIGVVAALTIPSLIAKYQKTQTMTQLKKAYSEINQAVKLSEAKYGTLDSWDLSYITNHRERMIYFGENFILPNIKTVKKCLPTSHECFKPTYNLDGKELSSKVNTTDDYVGSFIASSGYSVLFWPHSAGNGAWFFIDINGPDKAPNVLGRDVFSFLMSWGNAQKVGSTTSECTKNLGFLPVGLDCNTFQPTRDDLINGTGGLDFPRMACKKGAGLKDSGGYCSALIMYDGWEIKDDYPW